jgi:hypothetical protein
MCLFRRRPCGQVIAHGLLTRCTVYNAINKFGFVFRPSIFDLPCHSNHRWGWPVLLAKTRRHQCLMTRGAYMAPGPLHDRMQTTAVWVMPEPESVQSRPPGLGQCLKRCTVQAAQLQSGMELVAVSLRFHVDLHIHSHQQTDHFYGWQADGRCCLRLE